MNESENKMSNSTYYVWTWLLLPAFHEILILLTIYNVTRFWFKLGIYFALGIVFLMLKQDFDKRHDDITFSEGREKWNWFFKLLLKAFIFASGMQIILMIIFSGSSIIISFDDDFICVSRSFLLTYLLLHFVILGLVQGLTYKHF